MPKPTPRPTLHALLAGLLLLAAGCATPEPTPAPDLADGERLIPVTGGAAEEFPKSVVSGSVSIAAGFNTEQGRRVGAER